MVEEDNLRDRAKEAVEQLSSGVEVEASEDETVKIEERNEFDRKLEKDIETDEGVWSAQEVEYLVNNREKMSNDELEEFLNRNSDFQENDFERFSRSENEFVMRNFPSRSAEEIAAQIDRSEDEVRQKVKMLGLEHHLE